MKRAMLVLLTLSLALLTACSASAPGAIPAPETERIESAGPAAAAKPVSEPAASPGPAADAEPAALFIAAAASLEGVFVDQLIPLFQRDNPAITLVGSYDSSGKLQQQIEGGLEADVFMSAATKQMDALAASGLVDPASVVNLLENEIVLIAPAGSDTDIDAFGRIAEADIIVIGDPESVPAGQYAREALEGLGAWDAIRPKLSLAASVTEVLNQVAEGSADVGIVYATDAARMPDRVKILAAAPEGSLRQKILYPVGIVSGSKQRKAAEAFIAFLQGPEARRIFEANGFTMAR